jgi:hypothetical protein
MYTTLNEVSTYFVDILNERKSNYDLYDVFYGDQDRIPNTPSVCVEPGTKERQVQRIPKGTDITITIYLIVYHYQIATTEEIRSNVDVIAEMIESDIHTDPYLRGFGSTDMCISSLVTRIESGYRRKNNSLFRSSILTIEVQTREQLPTEYM